MMERLLSLAWVAVVAPFVIAVLVALIGRMNRMIAPALSALAPAGLGVVAIAALTGAHSEQIARAPWTSPLAASGAVTWLATSDYVVRLGYAIDSLAAVMLLVVAVVALAVVVFSVGYMANDPGWNRYFALLALFTGSMSVLVVADSFLPLFLGWELVGASSYLLIGFWYAKPQAAAAAVKAFVTTRVADVALLLGIAVLWAYFGVLDYERVLVAVDAVPKGVITTAAVLVALGAMGKSAQFPFHGWLPDAMEGPTPVSALIHAATMVAAGVYLTVRVWPLFALSPTAQLVLLGAGVVSAFGAAVIAVGQNDIKKVLAYSTISQLGFMFAALGVGAWGAAFFHLVTHAAFKALLFLTAGSVIHGSGTQDLREMGGLRASMPLSFGVWLVGAAALMGLPGLAGFFSKDAVLEAVWHTSPVLGGVLFAAGGLTALYMTRATRLAFLGPRRSGHHAHESRAPMALPLLALAAPAVGAGYAGSWLYEILGTEHAELALAIAGGALAFATLGIAVGWRLGSPTVAEKPASALGRAAASGFGWDRAVDRVVVQPFIRASRLLWAVVDRLIIDGTVEGLGALVRAGAAGMSRLHTGNAQSYASVVVLAALAVLAASVWLGG